MYPSSENKFNYTNEKTNSTADIYLFFGTNFPVHTLWNESKNADHFTQTIATVSEVSRSCMLVSQNT